MTRTATKTQSRRRRKLRPGEIPPPAPLIVTEPRVRRCASCYAGPFPTTHDLAAHYRAHHVEGPRP